MKTFKLLLATLLFLTLFGNVSAQELVESEEPQAIDHAMFGFSVDINSSLALVGSPHLDTDDIYQVGNVSVYENTGTEWIITSTIKPPISQYFLNFGHSVNISNSGSAFIGAIGDHENGMYSGAVYVFDDILSDSSQVSQKLKASDAKPGNRFGHTIDVFDVDELSESIIVVGAHQANGLEEKSGAVYVFEFDSELSQWVESQKLFASDGSSNDYFGHTVKIVSKNIIAIGAYNANGASERSGVVYLFEKDDLNQWVQTAKLFDPNGNSSDLYGFSISSTPIDQSVIKSITQNDYYGLLFIGAPGTQREDQKTGSVYIFTKNDVTGNWDFQLELIEPESIHNEHFGISLDVDLNEILYVGASRGDNGDIRNTGNVYKYQTEEFYVGNPGSGSETIEVEQLETLDSFGYKVSVYEDELVIGSPHSDSENSTNSGSAYFFDLPNVSEEFETGVVDSYRLFQNYPNPFNPSTAIKYQVKDAGDVRLSVYNLLGQEIQVLVNEQQIQGSYTANFDAGDLASGFYLYRLEINNFVRTKKMLLIK